MNQNNWGLSGVVQIIFLFLKLINFIEWSWWWVWSPTIISFIALIIINLGIISSSKK